jgi:hypothetical protein
MDVQGWLRKQLEDASPDLLRAMVKEMAEALMSAEAEALCGAGYGERSPERVKGLSKKRPCGPVEVLSSLCLGRLSEGVCDGDGAGEGAGRDVAGGDGLPR